LIQGDSGTGKELVARALHTIGPVPHGPFVTFNCSNLMESLAESQLFGHSRGAFTDAHGESDGYFRAADKGTLFLDEIAELPLSLQAKILRATETYEVQPVGSSQSFHVDIRLVVATNRDLRAMVKAGQFRDDLFYRMNTTVVQLPPLRERREDIPVLTAHFIDLYNRLIGKNVQYVSSGLLARLCELQWPGNIRELAHIIETAVIFTGGDRIDLPDVASVSTENDFRNAETHLASSINRSIEVEAGKARAESLSLDEVMKETLLRSLEETAGNRRRAAGLLGISRSTLYRMLARYGIERRRPAAHATDTDSKSNGSEPRD
jgi:two-component system response regulator HydG